MDSKAESELIETDIQKLAKLIKLPVLPASARYLTQEAPGGNDWSLTGILSFSDASERDALLGRQELSDAAPVPPALNEALSAAANGEAPGPPLTPDEVARSPLLHGYVRPVGDTGLLIHLMTM